MLSEKLKRRLTKDRPMTSITLRIPVDVIETLKQVAPLHGVSGYQTLVKMYISEGLRKDEALLASGSATRLVEALKKRGVSKKLLDEAVRESA